MSTELRSYGLAVRLVPGWDIRILKRSEAEIVLPSPVGDVPVGGVVQPMIHASTITMPPLVGDYGSHVVPSLGRGDIFVAIVEFGPDSRGAAMFSDGFPTLRARDFDTASLQRALPDKSGCQRFFAVGGRSFGLFCVVGSHLRRSALVARANEVLKGIEVEPL